jgi:hypothetical protein
MDMEQKIFFSACGPFDHNSSWSELRTKKQVLDFFDAKRDPEVHALLEKHPDFETLRVETCWKEDEDTLIYIWGISQPTVDLNDYGDHVGLRVEIDGKVVFNTMKPTSDSAKDHEPDCEYCVK